MKQLYMLNPSYIKYIPDDKIELCHYNLLVDVYYFYHGYKPTDKQKIICINDNIFDLSKHNLKIIDIDIIP